MGGVFMSILGVFNVYCYYLYVMINIYLMNDEDVLYSSEGGFGLEFNLCYVYV